MIRLIKSSWRMLVGHFMAGLIAILPLMLTVAIIVWVTSFIRDIMGPGTFLGRALGSVGMHYFGIGGFLGYLIGIGLVLFGILALGMFVNKGAKRFLTDKVDRLFTRVPVIGSLYGSLKQLVSMFDKSDTTKLKGMSVVYCYFGGLGTAGVLALMPSAEVINVDGQDYNVVIIPTAPVPFGGALIFVPVELVKPINMTVDNLVSIYVSMGVTTAEFMPKPNAQ
ncbi:MAG TPA: DUF502 domain-containing protein [Pirellulaceae bacterium]|nr:DUF502 domain-containing protein [Pirellulaceae bacterium]HMO92261.1 DUF502 domain-containing protein [Pirellulaceae bacterium]HMP70077.1 DUF502 domain-containing protein [Pirellulaceae bacterium]